MKKLRITYNNKVYEVMVEDLTSADGESGALSRIPAAPQAVAQPAAPPMTAPAPAAAQVQTAAVDEAVTSPMSGKVSELLVSVGDRVEADQPVIILEAMKLENEVYTDFSGVVSAIHVEQGQIVKTLDLLMSIRIE